MSHPEGRVLAIQQQMFFAQIFADELGVDTTIVLRKLAMAGLALTADANEHLVDAAAVYPKLRPESSSATSLKLVKEDI
jgi:hypothetical protein